MEKPGDEVTQELRSPLNGMVGTHYRLVQKSGLECSNEKTAFWQQLFEWPCVCQFFQHVLKGVAGTKTQFLVKEMTCVLYSWKICWSGGCLIENLSELADFFNLERRHRSDPGGSESFVAAPQDCWTGITFFQSDSHGIQWTCSRGKKHITFCVFSPDGSKNFTPASFFKKEGKPRKLILLNSYSCTFCFSSLEFCVCSFQHRPPFSPPFSGAAHVLKSSAPTKTVPETPGPGNQHHGP